MSEETTEQLKVKAWDKLREIDKCNEIIAEQEQTKQTLVGDIEKLKEQIDA